MKKQAYKRKRTASNWIKLLAMILSLVASPGVSAQPSFDGPYQLRYRLPAAEALRWYQAPVRDTLWRVELPAPLDTLWANIPVPYPGPGHYLLVSGAWDEIEYQLITVSNLRLHSRMVGRQCWLTVTDEAERLRADATLWLEGRRIPYYPDQQAYDLGRPARSAALQLSVPGDTIFYLLDRSHSSPPYRLAQWRRFKQTPTGWVVLRPYFWLRRGWQKLRPARNGRYLRPPYRTVYGYATLSQPQYRVGDTLRFAAYPVKRSGSDFRGGWELFIKGPKGTILMDTLLRPDGSGRYHYQQVLADSLPPGSYQLFFDHHRRREKWQRLSFRLADYELTAEQFTLAAAAKRFLRTDSVQLHFTAQDANGFPAFGTGVEVVVTTRRLEEWEPEQAPVPDTLLRVRKSISNGHYTLTIPDSLLPQARAQLLATAYFRAARGDLVKKEQAFFMDKRNRWQLRQTNRSLYWSGPAEAGDSPLLNAYDPAGNCLRTYTQIKATDSLVIQPEVFRYELIVGRDTLHEAVQSFYLTTPLAARWAGDSLLVTVDTNTICPMTLTIRDQAMAILLHDTLGDQYHYAHYVAADQVYIGFRYYWRGSWHDGHHQSFVKPTRQLHIETNQPQEVSPGAKVPVRIRVSDQQHRPVKRARVHLGGANAQFERNPNPLGPLIPSRRVRKRIPRWAIELTARKQRPQQALLTNEWISALAMDTLSYQQLRSGDAPLIVRMDTVAVPYSPYLADRAQFAPFLFHKGKQQAIHLIYCNRRLVYYHGVNVPTAYAFAGEPGYNQITLRTQDAEWTIDSVYLRAGWKTDLALHVDRVGDHPHLQHKPVPTKLTSAERQLLSQSMLQLRTRYGAQHFLYDTLGRVFDWTAPPHRHRQSLLLGPFLPGEVLTYVQPGYFDLRFPWQQDYRYELYPQRERLYHEPLFPITQVVDELPAVLARRGTGELLRDWRALPLHKPPPRPQYIRWQQFPRSLQADGAKLALTLAGDTNLLATVLVRDSLMARINPKTRYLTNLPAGPVKVYCFADTTTVARATVDLEPYTTHFLDLRKANWTRLSDSLAQHLLRLQYPVQMENYRETKLGNQTLLYGQVRESTTGEPVLFGSVAVYRQGILVAGTETDFDGNYELRNISPGWYEVEASYLGLEKVRISNVRIEAGRAVQVTLQMDPTDEDLLENITVVAYRIPQVVPDQMLRGSVLTRAQVRALPTRNVNAVAATTAGLSLDDDTDLLVRGSRTATTSYYVDGERVQGRWLPEASLTRNLLTENWDAAGALRSQFQDLAYWQPQLLTDKYGVVETTLQFPDDITTWNTYVLAAKGKSGGRLELPVRAYHKLQAQLFTPRFLVEGDELAVIGQSTNLGSDTLAIETRFWVGEEAQIPVKVPVLSDFINQRTQVVAPSNADSLAVAYALRHGNYTDGERRVIPIRMRGTRKARGRFWSLMGKDTTFSFRPDPEAGSLYLRWHRNAWPLLLEDLERVVDYPYTCNEQQASRLRALLVLREQHTAAQRDSLHSAIGAMIGALQRTQAPAGYWGWFEDNPANLPLSLYVLEALAEAQLAGFDTPAYERGLRYLTNNLVRMNTQDHLAALHFLARHGQQYPYATALQAYDTLQLSFFDHLQQLRIRQLRTLPYNLHTLYAFEQRTLKGGSYFGPSSRTLFRGHAATQALAHALLVDAGDSLIASRIRQYALLERGVNGWTNTLEAATWVKLLAPYLNPSGAGETETRVWIEGQAVAPSRNYTFEFTDPVSLRTLGSAPVYLTAYQWVHDTLGAAVSRSELEILSYWEQGQREQQQLRAGEPAKLIVEADIRSAMDYAVLEIPIPGGCGYLRELPRQGGESERVYLRDKLVIFYEHLPVGSLRVEVDLEPRFSGSFTLNPAKLEDLYFPTFFTRTNLRRMEITDSQ